MIEEAYKREREYGSRIPSDNPFDSLSGWYPKEPVEPPKNTLLVSRIPSDNPFDFQW